MIQLARKETSNERTMVYSGIVQINVYVVLSILTFTVNSVSEKSKKSEKLIW